MARFAAWALLCIAWASGGCASGWDSAWDSGGAPAPGTSEAWGFLRLVPREGVAGGGSESSYGDRRLRDVEFVDYTRPGFAVVYVREPQPPAGRVDLTIRASRVQARLEPIHAAVGAAGRLQVTNRSPAEHILSYPAGGVVRRIAPGESVDLPVARAGEQGIFLIDVPGTGTTLFASPGQYAVVSQAGRYEMRDLAPGDRELRVWHPRFPPAVAAVNLPADTSVRVDIELGVGRKDRGHAHP